MSQTAYLIRAGSNYQLLGKNRRSPRTSNQRQQSPAFSLPSAADENNNQARMHLLGISLFSGSPNCCQSFQPLWISRSRHGCLFTIKVTVSHRRCATVLCKKLGLQVCIIYRITKSMTAQVVLLPQNHSKWFKLIKIRDFRLLLIFRELRG